MRSGKKLENGGNESDHGAGPVRQRNWWIWVEAFLITVGLAALAVYTAARIDSYLGSRSELREFRVLSSHPVNQDSETGKRPAPEMRFRAVNFDGWDPHREQEYLQSAGSASRKPIAVIRIPRIHLEVPVLDGTDDRALNRGAGRIAGTARPGELGNIGIAGHRDGFFRGLKDVRVGDAIELTSLTGTQIYVVDRIQIVTPDDVRVLGPTPFPSLTLVTCYPFYFIGDAPKRYIVTASTKQHALPSAD